MTRVNLGSGPHATPGWLCFDRSPNMVIARIPGLKAVLLRARLLSDGHRDDWDPGVRRANITKQLPLAAGTVEAVYTSHVLEHLYLSDVRLVLAEAHRILQPHGILRINVPDALINARQLVDGVSVDRGDWGDPGRLFNHNLLAHPEQKPSPIDMVRRAIGGHIHVWQPTETQLRSLLAEANFIDVRRCEFRVGELPDLDVIETRDNSLYIEARKG